MANVAIDDSTNEPQFQVRTVAEAESVAPVADPPPTTGQLWPRGVYNPST
jgi:hypothetical protein